MKRSEFVEIRTGKETTEIINLDHFKRISYKHDPNDDTVRIVIICDSTIDFGWIKTKDADLIYKDLKELLRVKT